MKSVSGVRRWALSFALLIAGTASAAEGRLIAIGDIHGSLEGLVTILREAELTDAEGSWSGGEARLIQTGDFTDRGGEVRQVMDLLIDLQKQARRAKGEVVVLLGNHEVLNFMRHEESVAMTPEIYASFRDDRSAERRQKALADWRRWHEARSALKGLDLPAPTTDAEWLAAHPEGFVEYHEAMSRGGLYGRWLRTLPVVHQAEDMVFLHGGLSETFVEVSLDRVNELHREEIDALDDTLAQLERRQIIPPHATWDEIRHELATRLAGRTQGRERTLLEKAAGRLDRFLAVTASPDSPLWFRGFAPPPFGLADQPLASLYQLLVERYGARRYVTGHTPYNGGRIATRLGGAFFLIDTGMLTEVYSGRPSALEVTASGFTAIYPGERARVAGPEPPAVGEPAPVETEPAERSLHRVFGQPRFVLASNQQAEPAPEEEAEGFRSPPRRFVDRNGEPLPFTSPEEVERFLAAATVLASEPVGEGKTGAVRLDLEHEGVRARAIFHTIDDRRTPASSGGPVRLSRGTAMMRFRDSYSGQVAAYHVARLMGLETVPPAVVRDVDGVEGSVALWIEGGRTLTSYTEEHGTQPPDAYFRHQLSDVRVFDALINNKDRNTGNIFWTPDGNMWWIDHTRAFAQDPQLYRPEFVQRCSRDLLARIRQLDEEAAFGRLKPYLSTFEIKSIFKRRKRLLLHLEERARKLGEARVFFDYGDPLGLVTVSEVEASST